MPDAAAYRTARTVEQAVHVARAHGGDLWRWPDGYWSPADPNAQPTAEAIANGQVRHIRVSPVMMAALTRTTAVLVVGPGQVRVTR